mgnify:CR=1 FL=1
MSKISEIKKPSYLSTFEIPKVKFHSEVFMIYLDGRSVEGGPPGNDEYMDLMNKLYDHSTNIMIPPDMKPSKSFTKEGDIIIHVEYVEVLDESTSPDNREY